jgi:hypothetical protein
MDILPRVFLRRTAWRLKGSMIMFHVKRSDAVRYLRSVAKSRPLISQYWSDVHDALEATGYLSRGRLTVTALTLLAN